MTQVTSKDLYVNSLPSNIPTIVYGFHSRLSSNYRTASIGPIREYAVVQHPSQTRFELFLKKKSGSLGRNVYFYSTLEVYTSRYEAERAREEMRQKIVNKIDEKIKQLEELKQGLNI